MSLRNETVTTGSAREECFDYLRVVAAILVIVIHVCASEWKVVDIHSSDWVILSVYKTLAKISVPIFFMISGRFVLNPEKELSGKKLLQKCVRLVIAFAAWSTVYTILNICRVAAAGEPLSANMKWIVLEFFSGEYHMWFIYAIFGLYLITPFLRILVAKKKLTEYFLLLSVIFGVFWPYLEKVPHVGIVFLTIGEEMLLKFVTGLTCYYVAGFYLSHYPPNQRVRRVLYLLGIVGIAAAFFAVLLPSWATGQADESFAEYLSPWVFFASVGAYLCGIQCFKDSKRNSVVSVISKNSFGCYLIHPLFLWIFEWIGIKATLVSPLIAVPVITALALVLSVGATVLLKKIPAVNKIV